MGEWFGQHALVALIGGSIIFALIKNALELVEQREDERVSQSLRDRVLHAGTDRDEYRHLTRSRHEREAERQRAADEEARCESIKAREVRQRAELIALAAKLGPANVRRENAAFIPRSRITIGANHGVVVSINQAGGSIHQHVVVSGTGAGGSRLVVVDGEVVEPTNQRTPAQRPQRLRTVEARPYWTGGPGQGSTRGGRDTPREKHADDGKFPGAKFSFGADDSEGAGGDGADAACGDTASGDGGASCGDGGASGGE